MNVYEKSLKGVLIWEDRKAVKSMVKGYEHNMYFTTGVFFQSDFL